MKKIDKKIKEIRELQKIIDHRTAVENQAMQLIGECRFEEADTLLNMLDSLICCW